MDTRQYVVDAEDDGDGTVDAVYVRNATKNFGVGKRRHPVFCNLDMTVKRGHIYGLLGASGCGKTVLLTCIVGQCRLEAGEVLVFGKKPGTPEAAIPGPRVGYMPQEIALYGEFTIKETLEYFGRIYRLPRQFAKSQIDFYLKLLDLPTGKRKVKSLSGGQKRRVSLAVALFHQPELLILDEPTVGVDTLLRRTIWDHLVYLSTERGTTIIITTHYIEEARQAHMIGLMRCGVLLAEESPNTLLKMYGLSTLEDVFLKLCMTAQSPSNDQLAPLQAISDGKDQGAPDSAATADGDEEMNKQRAGENGDASYYANETKENYHSANSNDVGDTTSTSAVKRCMYKVPSAHRTAALIRKNFFQTFRNLGMFLFIFLLPAAQVILFCLAIGRDPENLKMAVVNDELDPSAGRVCNYTDGCPTSMLSCRFLQSIDNTTVIQMPFQDLNDAVEAARRGDVWGVIHIPQNFTKNLGVRQILGTKADNATILDSQISVRLDWSNQQISLTIQRRLVDGFESFIKNVLQACNLDSSAGSLPLSFVDPVYGDKNPSFTEFMAPGLISTIVFFIAVSLTAAVFISERKEGLLDRSLVAGVTTTEIMVAHLVNQFMVLCGQTALVFVFMLLAFAIPCHGNLALAVFITLLQGICGMSFGFLVSSICNEETSATHVALGSFYPTLLLSGVMWPLEGMPVVLKYISYCLPQTYAIESLRNIFARGWGIEKPGVYLGVITSFGWITVLLTLSLIVIRYRKYAG